MGLGLWQGWATLALEIHYPADFSYKRNQTDLNKLPSRSSGLLKSYRHASLIRVGVKRSRIVDLEGQSLGAVHTEHIFALKNTRYTQWYLKCRGAALVNGKAAMVLSRVFNLKCSAHVKSSRQVVMCEMLKNQQNACSHRKTIQKQRSVAKTFCELCLKLKVHSGFHTYTRVN